MNDFIYEVPVERVSAYRGRRLIVRAHEPATLITALADEEFERLVGLRRELRAPSRSLGLRSQLCDVLP